MNKKINTIPPTSLEDLGEWLAEAGMPSRPRAAIRSPLRTVEVARRGLGRPRQLPQPSDAAGGTWDETAAPRSGRGGSTVPASRAHGVAIPAHGEGVASGKHGAEPAGDECGRPGSTVAAGRRRRRLACALAGRGGVRLLPTAAVADGRSGDRVGPRRDELSASSLPDGRGRRGSSHRPGHARVAARCPSTRSAIATC